MYAHRQIYDSPQDTIPVPESMRHQRMEVIFIRLDDPAPAPAAMGLGTQMAGFFKDIPSAASPDEELSLPAKEYPSAVTFEG